MSSTGLVVVVEGCFCNNEIIYLVAVALDFAWQFSQLSGAA